MNPGDKVLCINDDFSQVIAELLTQSRGILNLPIKGQEYTIREIFDNEGITSSLLLEEVYNPSFYIPVLKVRRELSFASWRFEKIQTQVAFQEVTEELKLVA